jgi:hypothetical protein
MTDHLFDTDTRVEPAGDHAYRATLSDSWNALGGVPNGGYLLAVCLNALAGDMPLPDPVVVSATYLRPAATGAAELRTELVRAGRRVATGEVRLHQDGREIVRAIATFADLAEAQGPTTIRSAPPDLPAPEDSTDVMESAPRSPASTSPTASSTAPRSSPAGRAASRPATPTSRSGCASATAAIPTRSRSRRWSTPPPPRCSRPARPARPRSSSPSTSAAAPRPAGSPAARRPAT